VNFLSIFDKIESGTGIVEFKDNKKQPQLDWYWLNRCRFYTVSPKFRLKPKPKNQQNLDSSKLQA